MKGLFVTIEGPDGSGKSTVAQALKARLDQAGIDYCMTREPGGTAIAEKIRAIILDVDNEEMDARCEALLYAASRAQHTEKLIIPSLKEGKLVISDRYMLSSIAYQGAGRELGVDIVEKVNLFATQHLEPDLILFLDVDPITVLKRKAARAEQDRLELAGDDFHNRVYQGYQQAMKKAKNVVIIDAKKSPEEVIDKAWAAIEKKWRETR